MRTRLKLSAAAGLTALLLLGGCTTRADAQGKEFRSDTRHPPITSAAPAAGAELAALPEPSEEPAEVVTASFTGLASWYGKRFHGRLTASGEPFDMAALTAAHRGLPFGRRVRVTNLDNGRSVVVVINDRGPMVRSRLIDLSHAAARELGFLQSGLAKVRIDVLGDARG
jgi:rare lipoprotein A